MFWKDHLTKHNPFRACLARNSSMVSYYCSTVASFMHVDAFTGLLEQDVTKEVIYDKINIYLFQIQIRNMGTSLGKINTTRQSTEPSTYMQHSPGTPYNDSIRTLKLTHAPWLWLPNPPLGFCYCQGTSPVRTSTFTSKGVNTLAACGWYPQQPHGCFSVASMWA